MLKIILYILGVGVLAAFLFYFSNRERALKMLFGDPDMGQVEFSQIRPGKNPNQALACPQGLCANREPDLVSPLYALSADDLRKALRQGLEKELHLKRVAELPDALEERYVQHSPFWRFPDTIQVKFIPVSDTRSTIALFARAKIGVKDFGANRERIERWLGYLAPHRAN